MRKLLFEEVSYHEIRRNRAHLSEGVTRCRFKYHLKLYEGDEAMNCEINRQVLGGDIAWVDDPIGEKWHRTFEIKFVPAHFNNFKIKFSNDDDNVYREKFLVTEEA